MTAIIYSHATLATLESADDYGLITDAALVVVDGKIAWRGPQGEVPTAYTDIPRENLEGRLITPGLIDAHTHIVHAGNRAHEFEMRLNGASYADIARAGGGILSTVKQTRAASEAELLAAALPRIDALIAQGVCMIEIKSGYGLDIKTEIKMLRVAREIARVRPVRIRTSYLAAHALPAKYKNRADDYIDEVCIAGLKAAHALGLVDAVDGFCENIGFSPNQIKRVFDAAKTLGLPVKLHAEQLSNQGGAKLASSFGALSADHLEYLDEDGVEAMAKSGTVALILPGAFYTLGETQLPPIGSFRKAGVAMAVATDCNPGTSPMSSLLLAMNMACTLFKMTPCEALLGTTRNAAKALGLNDCGTLAIGSRADLAVWDVDHPAELSYTTGFNPLYRRIFGGAL